MVAVAESTPGPIGINAATYAGYTASGMFGGLVATLGIICPSIIIISKILDKFKNSRSVQSAFYGIRPAVMGMIGSVSLEMIRLAVFEGNKLGIKELVLFVVLLATSNKIKLHLNLSVPCLIKSTSPFS